MRAISITTRLAFISLLLCIIAGAASAQAKGKDPVIIIPGITGSTLVNPHTGKTVWFSIRRDNTDDLRLPMTSPVLSRDRDSLRPKDIIRKVEVKFLPDVEVYQNLIDALEEKGYTEAHWDHPKATDVYYVFPYDWRRDNVESAQLLMQRMQAVKRMLRRPDLKFDILAHSMGGLIARYAAMYGSADLAPEGKAPVPTWAGAVHINKLMMFGTPNEGAFSAFDSLLNGYPIIANRKLPFIDDLRPEDVLTSPAIFQLLPHRASAKFFDENLKPMSVDIYDPGTWIKYNWGPISDSKFLSKLRDAAQLAKTNPDIKPAKLGKNANADDRLLAQTTYAQVMAYFRSVLSRAKRFHAALDAPEKSVPIQIYAYGGNCAATPDAAILVRNEKKNQWDTILDPRDLKTSDGKLIKKDDLKTVLTALGDGRVTQRSLLTIDVPTVPVVAMTGGSDGETNIPIGLFSLTNSFLGCGTHTKLFLEKPIKDSFLSALVVQKTAQP